MKTSSNQKAHHSSLLHIKRSPMFIIEWWGTGREVKITTALSRTIQPSHCDVLYPLEGRKGSGQQGNKSLAWQRLHPRSWSRVADLETLNEIRIIVIFQFSYQLLVNSSQRFTSEPVYVIKSTSCLATINIFSPKDFLPAQDGILVYVYHKKKGNIRCSQINGVKDWEIVGWTSWWVIDLGTLCEPLCIFIPGDKVKVSEYWLLLSKMAAGVMVAASAPTLHPDTSNDPLKY